VCHALPLPSVGFITTHGHSTAHDYTRQLRCATYDPARPATSAPVVIDDACAELLPRAGVWKGITRLRGAGAPSRRVAAAFSVAGRRRRRRCRGRDRPRRRRLCPQRGQEPGVRVYARHCQPAQAQRGTPPPHLHTQQAPCTPHSPHTTVVLYPRAEALEHPKDRPHRSRDRTHARPRAAGRRPVGRRAHRQGVCGIAPHAPHASHITRRSFRVLTLAPLPTSITLSASRPVHRSARPCRAPRSPPSRTASPASSIR
jgi:hypothetical protein